MEKRRLALRKWKNVANCTWHLEFERALLTVRDSCSLEADIATSNLSPRSFELILFILLPLACKYIDSTFASKNCAIPSKENKNQLYEK